MPDTWQSLDDCVAAVLGGVALRPITEARKALIMDQWTWWRSALAGQQSPIQDGVVESGFYRYKMASGTHAPMAIWRDGAGKLICHICTGAEQVRLLTEDEVKRQWPHISKQPVARLDYANACQDGAWADGVAAWAVNRSNMPSDPLEALKIEIAEKLARAEEIAARPVETQLEADTAANLHAELLRLRQRADEMFRVEKAPILQAERDISAKYKFREIVEQSIKKLRALGDAYLDRETQRREKEAREKFERERAAAEAERARLEQERAQKLKADPIAALLDGPPELPLLPDKPEPVKVLIGGGVGNRRSLRREKEVIITDVNALVAHLMETPHADELRAVLVKLAKKEMAANVPVPGVKVEDKKGAA